MKKRTSTKISWRSDGRIVARGLPSDHRIEIDPPDEDGDLRWSVLVHPDPFDGDDTSPLRLSAYGHAPSLPVAKRETQRHYRKMLIALKAYDDAG